MQLGGRLLARYTLRFFKFVAHSKIISTHKIRVTVTAEVRLG